MDTAPVEIRYYQTASARRPFQDGEKKRQSADIQRAQAFWQDYLRRTTR